MKNDALFHLSFSPEVYSAKYAIVPGAPERCELIANLLNSPQKIAQNREYTTFIAKTNSGDNVFITSTGIGGPSTAIAVEELHIAGVDTFIRIGTAGGINLDVGAGDLAIATAAVRQEGTSLHYAPIEYPAAADFEVISALKSSADKLNLRSHLGVVQSKDSFYGQHSPTTKPVANDLLTKWEAWKRLNVLCSEMEAAALFTVAASLGCRAGAAFHILWNQEKKEIGVDEQKNLDTSNAVKCVVNAINILSENDKK